MADRCPCGRPLHYPSPAAQRFVERQIDALGPDVKVTTPVGSWMVPRHYIALHGLKAADLPSLGFPRA